LRLTGSTSANNLSAADLLFTPASSILCIAEAYSMNLYQPSKAKQSIPFRVSSISPLFQLPHAGRTYRIGMRCDSLFRYLSPSRSHVRTDQRPEWRVVFLIERYGHDDLASPTPSDKKTYTLAHSHHARKRSGSGRARQDVHAVPQQVHPASQPLVFQEPRDVGSHMFVIIRSFVR
jgi:hypothetical protein